VGKDAVSQDRADPVLPVSERQSVLLEDGFSVSVPDPQLLPSLAGALYPGWASSRRIGTALIVNGLKRKFFGVPCGSRGPAAYSLPLKGRARVGMG